MGSSREGDEERIRRDVIWGPMGPHGALRLSSSPPPPPPPSPPYYSLTTPYLVHSTPTLPRDAQELTLSNLIMTKFGRQFDENFVQFINVKNKRSVVDFMLTKMNKFIDVIIPRGGKNLVKKVQNL